MLTLNFEHVIKWSVSERKLEIMLKKKVLFLAKTCLLFLSINYCLYCECSHLITQHEFFSVLVRTHAQIYMNEQKIS